MYDELVKALRYCNTGGDRCVDCSYADTTGCIGVIREKAADTIEKLIKVIQNHDFLESLIKPHWIPVTEAPTLKIGDEGYPGYLVIYRNGCYDVADYAIGRFDNEPRFRVFDDYEPDITHYMPLPEPPKENGKSET